MTGSYGEREREREREDKMILDQLTPHLYSFSKLQMKSLKERERLCTKDSKLENTTKIWLDYLLYCFFLLNSKV